MFLCKQAQSFKPADVAAAFADFRDNGSPKSPFVVSSFAATTAASAAATATSSPFSEPSSSAGASAHARSGDESAGSSSMSAMGVEIEEEEDDEGEGLFVIGDDGSEASEVCETVCERVGGRDGDRQTQGREGKKTKRRCF